MDTSAKVLLIDDNRVFLDAMQGLMQSLTDYQIHCIDDPQAALLVALTEMPDVVVLDVYMPGLNGPQVCRQLKGHPSLRHIPVLFLTAVDSDSRFKARCLEDGADDFLQKPVSAEELIARIRGLLRIKALQDELRRERDELEQKVQERARELERSQTLAAIGKMVAGVAHEIRNPLSAISNSAAVLSRDLVLEGEDLRLMEIIVHESDRLRQTINDFLQFAHPQVCHFGPVQLEQIIRDVLFLAQRDSLCTENVQIAADIAAPLPGLVGDADRLHQVLWNLVRNSLEAVKSHGRIGVTAAPQNRSGTKGLGIRVVDSGPGIAPQDRELIFEPFFTRKPRGSGLGLALVHNAVRAHGGSIELAAPQDGQGCCFQIWLPLTQEFSP